MSLIVTIPKADLAKSIPISNGWHEFEIIAAFARPAKKDGGASVNYVLVHKMVNDINEREVEVNFSSKALGMANVWIAALTNKTVQEVLDAITTGQLTFDFEKAIGQKVMGRIEQKEWEGRIIGRIVDFAPIGKVPF